MKVNVVTYGYMCDRTFLVNVWIAVVDDIAEDI